MLEEEKVKEKVELYFLPFEQQDLGANASATVTKQLSREADFVLVAITGNSTGAYKLKIKDDNRNSYLTQDYCHDRSIVTDLAESTPFLMPAPYRFIGNGAISIELTDLSGSTNDIFITLVGYRVYKP